MHRAIRQAFPKCVQTQILYHERKDSVRPDILKMAIEHTAVKRESMDMLKDWKDIMRDMREETALYSLWRKNFLEDFNDFLFLQLYPSYGCIHVHCSSGSNPNH